MRLLVIVIIYLISMHATGQGYKTQYFDFSVNYWFNMHHFLYQEAFYQIESDSSLVNIPLSKNERKALDEAVMFYKNLLHEDLRMSEYMMDFKHWIMTPDKPMANIPAEFARHALVLKGFDNVYKLHFWPKHNQAIIESLESNFDLIRKTEQAYVDSIEQITRQVWQRDIIKVDVVYYGKVSKRNHRNRPYTSIFPTHVVMNVVGNNDVIGSWLELLYHEAAHHLILSETYFIGGTIWDVANDMNVNLPRQLWHMYLFYFTGEITRGLLKNLDIEYKETYIQRHGIYSRFFDLLDDHLKAYMKRETTLSAATRNMIEGIYKD